ncbi:outer membrane efflux protein [Bacteroides sp. CAG:661]|mgnify:FL=1|uniref:TolC family protein n=1 Tax=Mediterranea massiliensis TaxID=1841865 RepID=UPI00033AE184|nr:TolC family protein [Mediterranea massiliensis]CCZ48432.1 outer membrane efflux protein [Bacteroides sp. CAG:661]
MKRIGILCACLALAAGMHAQNSIDAILRQVEANNRQLQANAQTVRAQKLENRASNNLADPTLSYAHLWDSDDKNITVGELVIAQSFDFPSLYVSRARLNRLKGQSLDAQSDALRQQILLQAQEACLDIIHLSRRQQLLDERLKNAEELAAFYQRRLETGDASSLETNKINLELLNVRTEARLNRTALDSKLKELTALNGNQSLVPGRPMPDGPAAATAQNLGLTDYPSVPLPADFGPLCEELLASDPTLLSLQSESLAAQKQLSVSRQGWLPGLEVGYRRNTESRHPLNGIVVGFSFPIFQNQGKVKAARSQALSIDCQKENARLSASTALWQLYDEACNLHASMQEYAETFGRQQDLKLLRQALEGGQISMIEYFVEVSALYQSQANLLQLENQYQKVMARIYKNKL